MKDESLPMIPPSDRGQSHDEIAAEIADHLATAETELTKSGSAPEEARAAARKKFGDVEKIQKTCYWIQNGETVMLRWTLISLAAVLCILLSLSNFGNWRTQSQLADEMGKLSSELKAIAAAKQTPAAVPQPPEIGGILYSGSKDKPLANAEVMIMRTDGNVVRRTMTNTQGEYHSGPLDAGDYCITTKTTEAIPQPNTHWITQSKPLFIHAGSGNVSQNLDAKFPLARVKLRASRTLPQIRKEGKYLLTSRLGVYFVTPRLRYRKWTAADEMPPQWPVCFYEPGLTGGQGAMTASAVYQLRGGEEVDCIGMFAPGPTRVRAVLSFNIFPLDSSGKLLVVSTSSIQTSNNSLVPIPESYLNERGGTQWWNYPAGTAWATSLNQGKPAGNFRPERLEVTEDKLDTVEFREGGNRFQVEIPEGIELEIERVLEKTSKVEDFTKMVEDGLLERLLKLKRVDDSNTK